MLNTNKQDAQWLQSLPMHLGFDNLDIYFEDRSNVTELFPLHDAPKAVAWEENDLELRDMLEAAC